MSFVISIFLREVIKTDIRILNKFFYPYLKNPYRLIHCFFNTLNFWGWGLCLSCFFIAHQNIMGARRNVCRGGASPKRPPHGETGLHRERKRPP